HRTPVKLAHAILHGSSGRCDRVAATSFSCLKFQAPDCLRCENRGRRAKRFRASSAGHPTLNYLGRNAAMRAMRLLIPPGVMPPPVAESLTEQALIAPQDGRGPSRLRRINAPRPNWVARRINVHESSHGGG